MVSTNSSLAALVTRLYQSHFSELVGWLIRKFNLDFDGTIAEDAVQFAFTQMSAGLMKDGHAEPVAWLRVVAKHEAIRLLEDGNEEAPLEAAERFGTDAMDDRAEVLDLLAWVDQLTENQRKAILLWSNRYTYDQVAEALGWSRTQANRHITEGIASLRKLAGRG